MSEGSDRDSEEKLEGAAKIGRRTAQALVVAGLVYITVVAYSSIVPQVFRPEPSAEARERVPADCGVGLEALYDRLQRYAEIRIGENDPDFPDDPTFFVTWDDDFLAMNERCESEVTRALARHRYHLETTLRRYDREDGQLAHEVERALASRP